MAHIVCITSGLTGILHASFELVARLIAEGHQVTYACPQAVGEKVKAQGFDYVQLPAINYFPAPDLPDFQGKTRKIKRWFFKIKHKKNRQKTALKALNIREFEKKTQALQADLFLIDVELHDYIIHAVAHNWPVLLLSQWFSLWHQKGLPPLLDDTIPGVGWKGRAWGLTWTWWWLKRWRWWIFFKQRMRSGGTNRRSILKKYAQQVGFSKKYISENYWPGPFTYSHLPVMAMTAAELEFPHSHRKLLYYIGPMVFENRTDTKSNVVIEQQLERIFLKKRQQKKALIYCSVSTFKKGDRQFLKKIIAAVAPREDWLLILGLGGLLNSEFLAPLPQNVHAFAWVPQLKVLAQADCSINHGGIHTINECLHFRVPMLVYSGKKSDQNGCAARVHYHQIGRMADKDKDDVETIRANIHQVLTNQQYRQKINETWELCQHYKNNQILEEVVRRYCP